MFKKTIEGNNIQHGLDVGVTHIAVKYYVLNQVLSDSDPFLPALCNGHNAYNTVLMPQSPDSSCLCAWHKNQHRL